MIRLMTTCLALFAVVPNPLLADDPVPAGHSTVHIVFIEPQSYHHVMGGGGMGGTQSPNIRIGNIAGPADGIHTISITIDGDFVGHAMVGMWDIKPVFILPEGKHNLTFSIDGLDPVTSEISVLGTKSKQYLVVKLPTKNSESKSSPVSADTATPQTFDN